MLNKKILYIVSIEREYSKVRINSAHMQQNSYIFFSKTKTKPLHFKFRYMDDFLLVNYRLNSEFASYISLLTVTCFAVVDLYFTDCVLFWIVTFCKSVDSCGV